jgi:hypothetical protein
MVSMVWRSQTYIDLREANSDGSDNWVLCDFSINLRRVFLRRRLLLDGHAGIGFLVHVQKVVVGEWFADTRSRFFPECI